MSDPIKHHYVPQVYLRSFANSNKQFFQLQKRFKKIAVKTAAQVCYEKNYFRIRRDETLLFNKIEDVLHIERKVFTELENRYASLLSEIVFPNLYPFRMSRSSVEIFFEVLLNIKRRNPSVRKMLTDSLLQYVNSEKFLAYLEPGLELSRQIDNIDPVQYLKKFRYEINADKSRLSDRYLSGFMDEERRGEADVLHTLMSCAILVFHAPPDHQFITSDNPGFVLNCDTVINFGGLSQEFTFLFPLTPQCMLVLDKECPDNSLILNKLIHPVFVNGEVVDKLNDCTLHVANERVFSFSKTVLEKINTRPL